MSNIELYHGDCLEVMKQIPDGSVDMVLCDLPYGTTACKWDTVIPFEPLWEQYWRVCKSNASIILFGNFPFSAELVKSNLSQFKYSLVYEKTNPKGFLNAKSRPLTSHEDILVFYRKQPTYNPQMWVVPNYLRTKRKTFTISNGAEVYNSSAKRRKEDTGERFPRSVISFSNHNSRTQSFHPTQKPVALMEYLIKTYTNEGETVLDNCMGSGTTGVACKNLNRNFIGIEKELEYFEIAKKRIEKE